jgi:RNA polymerase sigma-70 factor (ECF subfamily)
MQELDLHFKGANINIEESVLVERCRRGDTAAMERLILRYQNRLYNVVLKICGNPDDAAELTQEAFVKIIESIDKFKGSSSFYTWAFRIAVNLTINHCKRGARLGFGSLEEQVSEMEGGESRTFRDILRDERSPDPAALAESREVQRIVKAALMKLDEGQRAIIVLRDIEGMNYAEIAQVFGVELGTVKSRLSRARANLRDILEAMLK